MFFFFFFSNLKKQEHISLSERSDKRKLAQLVLLPTGSWSNEVLNVSTHWRATCSFEKYGINHYKDYVRGRFADADIFAFIGSGVCLKTELVNIRGHMGIHRTARFCQVVNAYLLHIDSFQKGCQFDPTVDSLSSEDNFGLYGVVNPKFTCTMNADSTTQWWFGGYQ